MPPPESRHEQIAVAVESLLAGVDAAAYPDRFWYTAARVLRVDNFQVDFLDKRLLKDEEALYLLRPGDEFFVSEASMMHTVEAEMFVLAAKTWKPNTRNPYKQVPPRLWTVQSRLVRDIRVRVADDVRLAGLVEGLDVRDVSFDVQIEDAGVIWAAVELRLIARYGHVKGRP